MPDDETEVACVSATGSVGIAKSAEEINALRSLFFFYLPSLFVIACSTIVLFSLTATNHFCLRILDEGNVDTANSPASTRLFILASSTYVLYQLRRTLHLRALSVAKSSPHVQTEVVRGIH